MFPSDKFSDVPNGLYAGDNERIIVAKPIHWFTLRGQQQLWGLKRCNISTTLLGRRQCHQTSLYLLSKVDASGLGGCGGLRLYNRSSFIMWLRCAPHPPPSEKSDTRHQSKKQDATWCLGCSLLISPTIIKLFLPDCGGGWWAVREAAWEWWQSHLICSYFSQFLSRASPTPRESVSRASFTKAGLQWSDWDERPWGGCQPLPSARVLPLPHPG